MRELSDRVTTGNPKVVKLETELKIDPGASTPIVIAGNGGTVVLFRLANENSQSMGIFRASSVRIKYGEPNDEGLSTHPLHPYGLGYYGIFEVLRSPWIAAESQIDHSHMSDVDLRHLILTFHDSTFECLTSDFELRHELKMTPELILALVRSVSGA